MDFDYFVFFVDLVCHMEHVDLEDFLDLRWKTKYLDLLQQAMGLQDLSILFSNITFDIRSTSKLTYVACLIKLIKKLILEI